MNPSDATVGTRVRSLIDFSGVPKGTKGIIDEVYGSDSSVMIAWDLPDHSLPSGYVAYDGRSAIQSGILRDGFNKNEFHYLEIVREDA